MSMPLPNGSSSVASRLIALALEIDAQGLGKALDCYVGNSPWAAHDAAEAFAKALPEFGRLYAELAGTLIACADVRVEPNKPIDLMEFERPIQEMFAEQADRFKASLDRLSEDARSVMEGV